MKNFAYPCKKTAFFMLIISIAVILLCACTMNQQNNTMQFSIQIDPVVSDEPVSGRIILMISRTNEFRTGENGAPVFGMNVDDLQPGEAAILDNKAFGYPLGTVNNIPAGDYFIQCYLNIYTTFHRSDGHTIKLHMDQGEGQNWRRSPGNLYCEPVQAHIDPAEGKTIQIKLDKVIPPIPPREDTAWVKNIRIQSKLLTEFWGHPMEIGARILLPKGYDEHPNSRYPVHYIQGHFPRGNPGRFNENGNDTFSRTWMSDNFPRFIMVTFEHACPYYDDSYGVNSENCGPYGDAIVTELIPYIEKNFRAIGKPYARVLSGGSTGGWICLAQQIFYPDFFGGVWSSYPDQIDFRYYQIVNIYEDKNAYYTEHDWTRVPRPGARSTDGNIRYTMSQENHLEEALGDRYRSGGQWAIWNAVFAPVDKDGYPKPMWDPVTGEIDHETAQWAKEHYDLRYYVEQNWKKIGRDLAGKIHVICGRMDNYYLNEGCYLMEDFLESTKAPHYGGSFTYGARGGHGWSPWSRQNHYVELTKVMAQHISKNAPSGENTRQWKY